MLLPKILCFTLLLAIVFSQQTFNEKNNITRKDPNFPFQGEMFTGFIVVDNKTQANLYYHLFAVKETVLTNDAPVIIWLQGGPGCASAFGNYNELGPVKVLNTSNNTGFTYEKNEWTWNKLAHLVFIDQPTGSGFSRANGLNVSSTYQASQNFQVFLARFYQLYPELSSNQLFLFGESYAGKYVPMFASELLKNQTFSRMITIGGIGVGDGWSDPLRQVPTYGSYGYVSGVIDGSTRDKLRLQELEAITLIRNQEYWKATKIANTILDNLAAAAGGISEYNYREYDDGSNFPFSVWLNTTKTQDFLGIPYQPYEDCNADVSDDFESDNTQSVADLYPELIAKIPVLLYNGQDDDNVDYEGTLNYINALNWVDVKNFRKSERKVWKLSDGSKAGLVKGYGNFTFLLLFKAGHMVPIYVPQASYEMVNKFINKIPLH